MTWRNLKIKRFKWLIFHGVFRSWTKVCEVFVVCHSKLRRYFYLWSTVNCQISNDFRCILCDCWSSNTHLRFLGKKARLTDRSIPLVLFACVKTYRLFVFFRTAFNKVSIWVLKQDLGLSFRIKISVFFRWLFFAFDDRWLILSFAHPKRSISFSLINNYITFVWFTAAILYF